MKFKLKGKRNRIKTRAQRAKTPKSFKAPYKSRKKVQKPMTTDKHNKPESPPEDQPKDKIPAESTKDSATVAPATESEASGESTTMKEQIDTVRNLSNLKDFDAYIKELSASQANVSKMMGVLLPGHASTRDLVQAIWEGLYAHYQEEDWKLSDFSSFSSTMQRLTSMQNQFDALEMRRLEFARDHKALTQFSHKAMEAICEHADTLSPKALEQIESVINTL